MKITSADEKYVHIMLTQSPGKRRDRAIAELLRQSAIAIGEACECGSTDVEEGAPGQYRCCDCDTRWGRHE
jgi:hypothetical protein